MRARMPITSEPVLETGLEPPRPERGGSCLSSSPTEDFHQHEMEAGMTESVVGRAIKRDWDADAYR
jgi:hypothetical protein